MVEITLPIILQIVQTVGILVGIIYYITIMINQQRTREQSFKAQEEAEKTRQRDIVFQRLQGYSLEYAKAFIDVASFTDWETVDEFREKYGRITNPQAFAKFIYITRVYEFAGILIMENVADPELIFRLYPPGAVISLWETFSPYIQDVRNIRNSPDRNGAFEYLYNEAKKRYPDMLHRNVEYM